MPHCNEQPVQTPVGSSSLSGDLDIVDGIQGAVLMHMEEAQADTA